MASFMSELVARYFEIPTITRSYLTLCTLTTVAVQFDIVSPFQLYYNFKLIFREWQVWRLLTTFTFFGSVGFTFFFNLLFTTRYSRLLEENSFRNKKADFLFMILFGTFSCVLIAPLIDVLFLSHAYAYMLIYVWSKYNPDVRFVMWDMITLRAPYLPFVLMGISFLSGGSIINDLIGIGIGHLYYFFHDIFPTLPDSFHILITPYFLKRLFNEHDQSYQTLVEVPAETAPREDQLNENDNPNDNIPPQPNVNLDHPHQD